jgi:hypothetical protein
LLPIYGRPDNLHDHFSFIYQTSGVNAAAFSDHFIWVPIEVLVAVRRGSAYHAVVAALTGGFFPAENNKRWWWWSHKTTTGRVASRERGRTRGVK